MTKREMPNVHGMKRNYEARIAKDEGMIKFEKARPRFVCHSSLGIISCFVIRIAPAAPKLREGGSLCRFALRFLIQHSHSLRIGGPGFFMGIANGGQPGSPELTQRAHHVDHHAGLPRLIEVQIEPHHNIEKVVRTKCDTGGDST